MSHANTTPDTNMDRDQLKKLYKLHIEESLALSTLAFVTAEQLDSMPFIEVGTLDVDDNHSGSASTALFFQPFRPFDDEMREYFSENWDKLGPGQAPRVYPECSPSWFMEPWRESGWPRPELAIDSFGGTAWHVISERGYIRAVTGLRPPGGCIFHYPPGNQNGDYRHEFFCDLVFFPNDKFKPHLACIIGNTTIAPDGHVLRGEIDGAVTLIKYQLRTERFGNHHTKPVMLFTFQEEKYARITQAHYDAKLGKIILRQSRQFDIGGPEPTEDSWLLIRWFLNTPVGDTLIKPEDKGLAVDTEEPTASTLKPEEDSLSDDSKESPASTNKFEDDGRSDDTNQSPVTTPEPEEDGAPIDGKESPVTTPEPEEDGAPVDAKESAVSTLESDTKDWAVVALEPQEDGPSIDTKQTAVSTAQSSLRMITSWLITRSRLSAQ